MQDCLQTFFYKEPQAQAYQRTLFCVTSVPVMREADISMDKKILIWARMQIKYYDNEQAQYKACQML